MKQRKRVSTHRGRLQVDTSGLISVRMSVWWRGGVVAVFWSNVMRNATVSHQTRTVVGIGDYF